ncbi:hypothetical protein LWC35_37010 [Pseudonocardia kujensis]|uniref:hypothetical protein n=1 Tax=Pseudonocardia kujensis TaxID=1128675 RepID=UPI001E5E408A|nr:hypothetical protein [Pseudonocardia kujensis]MCE0768454.1 hypothetical protein [Pseudonocardia kujensis]
MDSTSTPAFEHIRVEGTGWAHLEFEMARVADLEAELASLREMVAGLQRTVAHLRCSSAALPAALQPVVARAMVEAGHSEGPSR